MSLTNISLAEVVKKQYQYKLRAYIQVLLSLLMLQGLAILFSFGGVGSMGTSSSTIKFTIRFYSADMVVGFTLLWGFITAFLITTKAYRNEDFVFITNRLSSSLANLLFLLTASVIGGVTSMLSTFLIKVIMYFFLDGSYVKNLNPFAAPGAFLTGLLAAILYIFLFCSLGYLAGTLVQISKLFIALIPGVLIGSLFLAEAHGKPGIFQQIYEIYFKESSFSIFLVKTVVTAAILFLGAYVLSNRMEVKA